MQNFNLSALWKVTVGLYFHCIECFGKISWSVGFLRLVYCLRVRPDKQWQKASSSLTLANALAYSVGGSSMMKKSFMAQENQYCQQSFWKVGGLNNMTVLKTWNFKNFLKSWNENF